LVAGSWFVLREKYCWLVADKPSEQGAGGLARSSRERSLHRSPKPPSFSPRSPSLIHEIQSEKATASRPAKAYNYESPDASCNERLVAPGHWAHTHRPPCQQPLCAAALPVAEAAPTTAAGIRLAVRPVTRVPALTENDGCDPDITTSLLLVQRVMGGAHA
jgi:hypothetical protein